MLPHWQRCYLEICRNLNFNCQTESNTKHAALGFECYDGIGTGKSVMRQMRTKHALGKDV